MLGMQQYAVRKFGKAISGFIEECGILEADWIDADVFHGGAFHGRMNEILDAVRTRRVILVGPPHLRRIPASQLPFDCFIEVPEKNLFLSLDEIHASIRQAVRYRDEPLLISLSASMPAGILCDRLHAEFGQRHSIVDFGSLWDPLAGVASRGYMRSAGSSQSSWGRLY